MADQPIEETVQELGYCCPYGYFTYTHGVRKDIVAAQLGVSERAVGLWRQRVASAHHRCPLITRDSHVRDTTDCIYADGIDCFSAVDPAAPSVP